MRWGLAARVALIASGAMLLAITATIAVSGLVFHREYEAALDSRALAVATGLEVQLQRVLQLGIPLENLVGFDEQCREAVSTYDDIDRVLVVRRDGVVAFGSDLGGRAPAVTDPALLAAVRGDRPRVVESATGGRASVVPVHGASGAPLASVIVEVPGSVLVAKLARVALTNVGLGLLVLGLGIAALVATLSALVTKPLARLVDALQDVRHTTDLSRRAPITSGGDVARLASAFNGLLEDLQRTTVSKGELENALRELRETEERHRRVLESAPTAIFVEDGAGLAFVNASGARLLGAARAEQLLGRALLDFVPAESRGRVADVARSLAAGDETVHGELKLARLDGALRDVEITAIALSWDGAPATQFVVQDVTERKAIQAHLVAAGRLASLGTLARGVAHEINNPLAYVISGLQYVRDEVATMPGARVAETLDAIDDARRGADQVRNIVRDLQAFARENERVGPVDLERVLDLAVKMALSQIRFRARLVKEYERLPPVLANETRLTQVFLNLLVNAAHAIPEGRPDLNEIRLALRADAGRAVVEIRDTGCGIPPGVREQIFDPFFTTKQVGSGSGLGLFISAGIVRGMGGEITFDTEVGHGTTFRVAVPLSSSHPARARGIAEPELQAG